MTQRATIPSAMLRLKISRYCIVTTFQTAARRGNLMSFCGTTFRQSVRDRDVDEYSFRVCECLTISLRVDSAVRQFGTLNELRPASLLKAVRNV